MSIQPSKSLLDTVLLGYKQNNDLPPERLQIEFLEGDSIITTVSTGFQKHDDKPVIKDKIDVKSIRYSKNKDSIINNVDTGFSKCNTIVIDCNKKLPKYKTCLYKENYLGEFKSETEKALARFNLGVLNLKEIENKIQSMITQNKLISVIDLENRLDKLDFVDSRLKSNLKYNIPEKLFKL